jgi:hypothetical protein
MLCPGVQALIANNVCAPVPEIERRVPPLVTYNWQTRGAEHPLPDTPDMAGPDIICPDNSTVAVRLTSSVRFAMPETIGDIVCRAVAHTTVEDICFVHYPSEEVPGWLFQAQDIEPALVGVTRRMSGIAHSVDAGSCLESEHGALRAEVC